MEIPEGVTEIGNYAFYDCSGLTGVEIPEGVTEIGWNAFYGYSWLTNITIKSTQLSSIGFNAFDYISASATFYVSAEKVEEYNNKFFRDYNVEAIPE